MEAAHDEAYEKATTAMKSESERVKAEILSHMEFFKDLAREFEAINVRMTSDVEAFCKQWLEEFGEDLRK